MKKYNSPFSVGHRKPITIFSDDPRIANKKDFNKLRGTAGKDVLVRNKVLQQELSGYYPSWTMTLGNFGAWAFIKASLNDDIVYSKRDTASSIQYTSTLANIQKEGKISWAKSFKIVSGHTSYFYDMNAANYFYKNIYYCIGSAILKATSSGQIMWVKGYDQTIPSLSHGAFEFYDLSVTSDGSTYAISSPLSSDGLYTNLILGIFKIDSLGEIIWYKSLSVIGATSQAEVLGSRVVVKNDKIYIWTKLYYFSGGWRWVLVILNTDGDILSSSAVDNPIFSPYSYWSALTVDNAGNAYTMLYNIGRSSVIVFKFDSSGAKVWSSVLSNLNGLNFSSNQTCLEINEKNELILLGYISGAYDKIRIVKIDSDTGDVVYSKGFYSRGFYNLSVTNSSIIALLDEGIIKIPTSGVIAGNEISYEYDGDIWSYPYEDKNDIIKGLDEDSAMSFDIVGLQGETMVSEMGIVSHNLISNVVQTTLTVGGYGTDFSYYTKII